MNDIQRAIDKLWSLVQHTDPNDYIPKDHLSLMLGVIEAAHRVLEYSTVPTPQIRDDLKASLQAWANHLNGEESK